MSVNCNFYHTRFVFLYYFYFYYFLFRNVVYYFPILNLRVKQNSTLFFCLLRKVKPTFKFVKTRQFYLWFAAVLNVYARGRTRMLAVSGHIIVVLSSLSAVRCDVWEWRIAARRCCCWCRCQCQEGAFDIHYISLPQRHIVIVF